MKRTTLLAATATAGLALLSGCQLLGIGNGGDGDGGGSGDARPQESQAAATSAASAPAEDDGGQAAAPETGQPEPDNGSGSPGVGEAVPIGPFRGTSDTTHDTLYFTSPSGKHKCAIGPDDTGCNSSALPADAPDVPGVDGESERPNAVVLQPGRKATYAQTGDPAYEFEASNPGSGKGKVLPYGQAISLHGTTCTSARAGITCTNGAHGFTLSSERVALH
ncbi:hypothetical protein GSY69_08480 [Brevibacterium sp. 5221]|uniref:Lipoprotein n=1 Tax=Brevibacterium rongguiense TaxID=2695267 RepID=A0A6N9H7E6_9MICO|nr:MULTISPECIES: hypothetical protein [Brevibacterium]MYM19998.1 hypothetical protein [Brevibacterium rongguiense]WAL40288.1 hypothetical protein BRM1_13875 [Brevibacterium sp. BRM-1]